MIRTSSNEHIRAGCVDMWNAFMLEGAEFVLGSDMPICPCTVTRVPKKIFLYPEAFRLHKKLSKINPNYHIDAYIAFYCDDQKFDGRRSGIWANPYEALELILHFSGVITPDFSTNADFPAPIKIYNTFRMRAFGFWLTKNGVPVINNVRWGTEETWEYCFDGIPFNSIVAIGTVASGLRLLKNRPDFERGLYKMVEILKPHTIIVYGSANYDCFRKLSDSGIKIISFPSQTSLAFASMKGGGDTE
ncbi:MAG: DUF4417 domain-containing protein [Lachnospiraceae bacterium]|nr:DUF4417 domain-containing protein [Lachnospiraceae bacterium]